MKQIRLFYSISVLFLVFVFYISCGQDFQSGDSEQELNSFYQNKKEEIDSIFEELEKFQYINAISSRDSLRAIIYISKRLGREPYIFLPFDSLIRAIKDIEGETLNPESLKFGEIINQAAIHKNAIMITLINPSYYLVKFTPSVTPRGNTLNINTNSKDLVYLTDQIVALKRGKHGARFLRMNPFRSFD